jgi:cell division septum initiation protein DivIVA
MNEYVKISIEKYDAYREQEKEINDLEKRIDEEKNSRVIYSRHYFNWGDNKKVYADNIDEALKEVLIENDTYLEDIRKLKQQVKELKKKKKPLFGFNMNETL